MGKHLKRCNGGLGNMFRGVKIGVSDLQTIDRQPLPLHLHDLTHNRDHAMLKFDDHNNNYYYYYYTATTTKTKTKITATAAAAAAAATTTTAAAATATATPPPLPTTTTTTTTTITTRERHTNQNNAALHKSLSGYDNSPVEQARS